MMFPASVILAVLETMSYDTYLTITRFPCSVTVRIPLAEALINIGFIELSSYGYKLTCAGEKFLNISREHSKI